METKTSTFTATHGVMTQEVSVISGELELRTTCQENGTLELKIAYVGAIDVYTLPGSYRVHDVRDHDVIHQMLVNVLERT
ncbi:hypothetical protein ITJ88_14305 [Exiguobacterium sp. TBG-PICH-001]|uniref:hypothetical protein n=1 Tax=Exiguobacterium abrahamii TaxID=2785532 RepID=UPI0018A79009|nr:hypothetical protein [Exiguobacterium sp. TBG-PICH-001]MBF8154453.1 hypothetical protein [Exiguobacterium sp. TBG-PICH-001]